MEGLLAAGADPFQEDASHHTPMELFTDPNGRGARVIGDVVWFAQWVAQAQAERLANTTTLAASPRPKARI